MQEKMIKMMMTVNHNEDALTNQLTGCGWLSTMDRGRNTYIVSLIVGGRVKSSTTS